MSLKDWEARILAEPGAAERVAGLETELQAALSSPFSASRAPVEPRKRAGASRTGVNPVGGPCSD